MNLEICYKKQKEKEKKKRNELRNRKRQRQNQSPGRKVQKNSKYMNVGWGIFVQRMSSIFVSVFLQNRED